MWLYINVLIVLLNAADIKFWYIVSFKLCVCAIKCIIKYICTEFFNFHARNSHFHAKVQHSRISMQQSGPYRPP
jgi:hypothetical protein